ncbi:MAG: SDR family oxidoreductase [Xanthomonadaceae bacterium]|nr:SDR family oxidoreductase [Xanthomonadaceae bacterium]MDE1884778.1 SDR family oxidoreductase [Xanthomonadaceae bacterium]MDE1960020.1 SDR family oxidoreductase [Xanthomonadaceae bacterium]MDE2083915.1 SDR family oxidoreductase [Xanthomonadaceae bacterium]MDE2256618.1 SDR family oxidoreductase [Xanthomonadaceae bacterium]
MKRILVTGTNRGLGLEFVRQLLARGDRVIACCRHPGKALALTELAAAHPGHLHVLPLDLASERSIAEAVRETAALTAALDVLINNAGMLVSNERFGAIAHKSLVDSFTANAAGPLLLAQALCPLLEKSAHAKVMNISSRLGSQSFVTGFGTPSYAMSKAALNMATRQLAAVLTPRGITVFCVSPGWVSTDMGGANAPVTPQDSVAGLLTVLDAATTHDAGRFVDYKGAEIGW